MGTYSFDWVDAFTTQPFGGNGCAVVHGADDLPVETRTALVRETKLSECAYVVRSDVADFGARYYLAEREILMAGHPTVATIVSLIHRGLVPVPSTFTLEVGAGVMQIEVSAAEGGPLVTMTQSRPVFGETCDPALTAAVFGLEAEDIVGGPQIVSTGTPFGITVVCDRAALDRAVLNPARLADWIGGLGRDYPGLFEPFLVTLGGATEAGDTYARLLMPPPATGEDPFTGSATGCMAAYLWHHDLIPSPRFVAEQGHGMGRPGQAQVEVLGAPDDITGVKVGGQGVVLMEGILRLG